jgi:hypothetical protein
MRLLFVAVAAVAGLCLGEVHRPSGGVSISAKSLLLPLGPPGHTVSYNVWATSGCFQWSSTDPTVVTVEPLAADDAPVVAAGDASSADLNVDTRCRGHGPCLCSCSGACMCACTRARACSCTCVRLWLGDCASGGAASDPTLPPLCLRTPVAVYPALHRFRVFPACMCAAGTG